MSISSVSSYNPLAAVFSLQQIDSSKIDSNLTASDSIQSSGDKAKFSQMGQMMSQLTQLQSSDPTAFKEVAQKISDDLATQAANATDTTQSSMLSGMSAKFASAAKTGDMSSLKPSGHSGSSGKTRNASGSGGQDPMDSVTSAIADELSALSNASTLTSSNANLQGMGGFEGMKYLMDQLKNLETSDPAKFKEITGKISADLASQAENATGTRAGSMLSDMSAKFAEASKSGDMSSLKPSTPPPPPPSMSGMGTSSGSSDGTTSSGNDSQLVADQQIQSLFARIQQLMASDLSFASSASASSAA